MATRTPGPRSPNHYAGLQTGPNTPESVVVAAFCAALQREAATTSRMMWRQGIKDLLKLATFGLIVWSFFKITDPFLDPPKPDRPAAAQQINTNAPGLAPGSGT